MYDYALVHIVYTIPIAAALSIIIGPLLTRRDVYKICFLQVVAVTYTIPWDSYLIKNRIWTYPSDVIVGPKLFEIPAEELFFFIVQTYITTCLQILLNKSVVTAAFLHNEANAQSPATKSLLLWRRTGQAILGLCSVLPVVVGDGHDQSRYMRLILAWACPVMLMLWSFAYQLLVNLPRTQTWLPILAPTLYLWVVDTLALRRGTWSVELGTKLGIVVWPHLEIEEAVFFLLTNTLVVWGAVAFDNATAVLDMFPQHFPSVTAFPSIAQLLQALFLPTAKYDTARLQGIRNALTILAKKSRSFYLASGVFEGRLRIDLILLYAFCRVADDLIDDAPSEEEAGMWISHFQRFLDAVYSSKQDTECMQRVLQPFPPSAQSVLILLPRDKLPPGPLYGLLDGFRIDQKFLSKNSRIDPPIKEFADLERYANCVAATIGESCLHLVYRHDPDWATNERSKQHCLAAGAAMGRALQYVNIARDVTNDAKVGRCYIPSDWFDQGLGSTQTRLAEMILDHRKQILDTAFDLYSENRAAIENLPSYARGGIRVAVESYMEIGRVMRERMSQGKPLDFAGSGKRGRASVPKARRIWVGWKTMAGWGGKT